MLVTFRATELYGTVRNLEPCTPNSSLLCELRLWPSNYGQFAQSMPVDVDKITRSAITAIVN